MTSISYHNSPTTLQFQHLDRLPLRVAVYKCGKCSYGSVTYAELSYHSRIHTSGSLCGLCDFAASKAMSVDDHLRSHKGRLPSVCLCRIKQSCVSYLGHDVT